ncbi:DUF6503 family protein [Flavivirga spongiicola]|uniref:DUF6503 family protein n=1 Tax=Flavivirga spongiicola TaxID=421621 RepID=A0ABU7XRZ9_9FLAO|nr:DUF6503 family protein [Flavivirga sp. MEBiC05379]MDO5978544.1 DUF6503 family protein [Flavivirga sp. MEBiC05379]
MKALLLTLAFFGLLPQLNSQNLTGTQLLEKAIQYHDQDGNWSSFNGQFSVTMETPNNSPRHSNIIINLPEDYFQVIATRDSITTKFTINKGNCSFSLNDSINISEENIKKHRLNCKRAELYKNYYTYLYGLPMKLKDAGTIIEEKVDKKIFKGKTYLVLKVSYDANIGSDIWYFYFNPKSYAMEVYQFFKTNKNGQQIDDSGEYIMLTGEKVINGIKMPKNRAWYYNKDDKYLGTDILN